MKYVTRSHNDTLYSMMRGLISDTNQFHQIKGFNGFEASLRYLLYIIDANDGIIVNIDEDCFVIDESSIDKIVNDMIKGGYAIAGIPDGGVMLGRTRSWMVLNPFFLVIDCTKIKTAMDGFTEKQITSWFPKEFTDPPFILRNGYIHDQIEPFCGLFYWLHEHVKVMRLDARANQDGVSCEPLYMNNPFAYHSWYAREYMTDRYHTNRINNLYLNAKRYSTLS